MLIFSSLKKINNLFLICREIYGKENDLKYFLIILFNIFTILLEVISITLILPVIDLILNDGKLTFFKLPFNELNTQTLLLLIITLFTLKSILLIFINRYQLRVTFNLSKDLSSRLFKKYLSKDYIFFTESNSSILLRNIFAECNIFAISVMNSVFKLLSDFFVVSFLIIFLFQFNPKITFFFIIFFLFLIGIYLLFVKDILLKLGEERSTSENSRIKFIQEGFRSFQLIKSFNLKKFFTKKYEIQNKISHEVYFQERFFSFLPKIIFELSIVIFLVVIIYILTIYFDNDKSFIIIQLSAFGIVSLRLMPVLNSMIYGLQVIRFHTNVITHLHKIFNEKNEENDLVEVNKSINKNFSLKNIYYKYPNTNKYILQDLSFTFNKGDTISISGTSGEGKSTLLNIIMGILKIDKGSIEIDNKNIDSKNNFNIKNLGFVPQNVFLLDENIKDNIILNSPYDESKFYKTLRLSGLSNFYETYSNKQTLLGEAGIKLSGGQKQRIAIARALYCNSEIIVLDEPTSSIDRETRIKIYNFLGEINKETNCTIIIVSHDKIPDGVTKFNYLLENGKLNKLTNL